MEIKAEIHRLENKFSNLTFNAQEDMISNEVEVRHLRQSFFLRPGDLRSEHKSFVKENKAELKGAESIEDLFITADEYWDFLNFSLLQHLINRHASEEIKVEVVEYCQQIRSFRKKTQLNIFSKVYQRKEVKKVDNNFCKIITEHNIDWSTATLEYVETFRNQLCSELSLYEFSLQVALLISGSVVITWLVPQSLVEYFLKSVKLNGRSLKDHHLKDHHVTKFMIDGFIVYDANTGVLTESLKRYEVYMYIHHV